MMVGYMNDAIIKQLLDTKAGVIEIRNLNTLMDFILRVKKCIVFASAINQHGLEYLF